MNRNTNLNVISMVAIILMSVLGGYFIGKFVPTQVGASTGLKSVYIAPYINTTHNCYFHTLGCQGELNDTEMTYSIISGDGTIAVNNSTFTESNGFFELELPSQKSYSIVISITMNNDTFTGFTTFNTYADGADCITTAKLSQ